MRVAVFRAAEDGLRTAKRLAALGHDAVLAPVIEAKPTGCGLPSGMPDAVIFTSAHGVEAVANDAALPGLLSRPCYCVGSRTAGRASALGFSDVRDARADAERLAALIGSKLGRGARLLLVCGRDRKPTLERTLVAEGYVVDASEVYEATPTPPWTASTVEALSDQGTSCALHYSRRSADLALRQAEAAGLNAVFLALRHCCLSEDAAEPIRHAGARSVSAAEHPEETTLLALL